MAAEVGLALLSTTLQVAIERLGSRDFFGSKVKDELLEKLQSKPISINQVLEDAEKMQYENKSVMQWLGLLKDAVYMADDLLDEIATEAAQQKLEAEFPTASSKVRNVFTGFVNSFDKGIETRIEKLLDKLQFLAQQKDDLRLREGVGAGHGVGWKSSKSFQLTSLMGDSRMYGRDIDKEEIIEFLFSDNQCSNQFSVISIVGMGGMGKTTLTQHVYNDKRVEDQFDLKAWACVSDDFDVVRVTKLILGALFCTPKDTVDLNLLQLQMKETLMEKKLLLGMSIKLCGRPCRFPFTMEVWEARSLLQHAVER